MVDIFHDFHVKHYDFLSGVMRVYVCGARYVSCVTDAPIWPAMHHTPRLTELISSLLLI